MTIIEKILESKPEAWEFDKHEIWNDDLDIKFCTRTFKPLNYPGHVWHKREFKHVKAFLTERLRKGHLVRDYRRCLNETVNDAIDILERTNNPASKQFVHGGVKFKIEVSNA